MRHLCLSDEQRQELVQLRNNAKVAYLRERAAALVKIADGWCAQRVAHYGLLRRRKPDTVRDWLTRYEQEGIAGLKIRPGRGRKPAFSPSQV